jgi:ubiquinone/menaquinone biosynthesis C-methylase UbiE
VILSLGCTGSYDQEVPSRRKVTRVKPGSSTTSSYDLNAKFWIKIIRENLDRYRTELTNPAVLDAVGDCRGSRLLDAGCGEGYLSRMFAERDAQVDGIDSSPSLVEAARAASSLEADRIDYHVGDVTRMDFAGEIFDIVVCNHLLNDLPVPADAISEFYRVLKPGGRLIILMLHPCFYGFRIRSENNSVRLPVSDYFIARRADQLFDVAGILSPAPVTVYVRSLEYYSEAIISAGFRITSLREPHPSDEQLQDEWWQQKFSVPLFLLITAVRS